MKKTRFTESQIFTILKEYDAGKNIQEVSREHGVSKATIYNWKSRYGGMQMNELKRVKELEAEVAQYKKIVAEQTLDIHILKDVIQKKL